MAEPELVGFVPPTIPKILPHEKVFSIQIGNELFRLSGASLSSDAPSYFTHFFLKELEKLTEQEQEDANVMAWSRPPNGLDGRMIPQREVKTLYIDRDPETFRDIANHLQGYYVRPRDPTHFVRLLSDAQFYTLPKLLRQLHQSDICVNIGGRAFTVPRDSFSEPGNDKNFFTIGLDINLNRDHKNDKFPGLDRTGLLRPPSIEPPYLPNRDPVIFEELLRFLRGYPIHVRDEDHREDLLRDCRYYGFRALEQKLIPHSVCFNPRTCREEIVMRIEDLKKAGFQIIPLAFENPLNVNAAWLSYTRPFTGEQPRDLIMEIGGYSMKLDLRNRRAQFTGDTLARVAALYQIIADKLRMLPEGTTGRLGLGETGLCGGGEYPRIRIERDCYILLDGEEFIDAAGPSTTTTQTTTQASTPQTNFQSPPSFQSPSPAPSQISQPATPFHFCPSRPGTAGTVGTPASETGSSLSGLSGDMMDGVQSPGMLSPPPAPGQFLGPTQRMMRRNRKMEDTGEWIVKRGQFRIRIQEGPVGSDGKSGREAVFVGVKIEAVSGEWGRNSLRKFLN